MLLSLRTDPESDVHRALLPPGAQKPADPTAPLPAKAPERLGRLRIDYSTVRRLEGIPEVAEACSHQATLTHAAMDSAQDSAAGTTPQRLAMSRFPQTVLPGASLLNRLPTFLGPEKR